MSNQYRVKKLRFGHLRLPRTKKPRNPLFYTPHTAVYMHDLTGYEG
jgi:hypothetical protein